MRYFMMLTLCLLLTGCISEPEIKIDSIVNGDIYSSDVTIHIDENQSDPFTLLLNNHPIKNHHVITENGQYELTITSRHFWKEKVETITFERDDKPPVVPAFYPEIPSMNFKEVSFQLIEEKDVTYSATINGNPVDLNQKFTEEGTHTLVLKATKDNGLTSSRAYTFIIDNQTYSKETISKFLSFYFSDDIQNVYKWTEPIEIYIHGKPTAKDRSIILSQVASLNELLPIDLKVMEGKGENRTALSNFRIDMHFVPNNRFKDFGFEGDLVTHKGEVVGLAIPTFHSVGKLYKSEILIGTNTPQSERETTIFHEFFHVLGFYAHSDERSSILYPYTDTMLTKLSDFDRKAIEILYRDDIHPNMTKKDVENVLKVRTIE
ncbi:DUF2927 domain-containing protein [Bacillus salitolerans]|uniref:DUF2927 domain-containing protein n=1 Tax=Bacillus salitolerans TaxID=1437434 RepID=A0ABW4LVM8_9BACI